MFSSNSSQVSSAAVFVEDVMSTYLYTGTGAALTITNNIDLSTYGGLVWVKCRNDTNPHALYDTVRGAGYKVISSQTNAQSYNADTLTAFNNNGFSLGADVNGFVNYSTLTYASWTFRKQPKFFDVVTYTGTGSNTTIPHSLGSAPGCIIVKKTNSTSQWCVYHRGLTSAAYGIFLNLTDPQTSDPALWNSTAPTSAVFSLGNSTGVNNLGDSYVAYLFAHDAGGFGLAGTDNVISCGGFTADGSGNATVSLGYEPQWILTKRTSSATDWQVYDVMRGLTVDNVAQKVLYPNLSSVEGGGYNYAINSTGFSLTGVGASNTFIYIAIRRGPMKVPTDATKVFLPNNGASSTSGQTISTTFPVDLIMSAYQTQGYVGLSNDRLRGISNTNTAGTTPALQTSTTDAESAFSAANPWFIKAVNNSITRGSNGADPSGGIVSWLFGRAPSFFDEVCWTGNSTYGRSLSHNLAAVPELLITKGRSVGSSWFVYSNFTPTSFKYGNLNTTSLFSSRLYTDVAEGLSSQPTSTALNLDDSGRTNNSGDTYVAYLFATCAGVSKVGTYTGNGTTQTIDCGFGAGGARFVLIKRTDASGAWYTYDTARGMTVLTDPYLLLNSTAAEVATLGSVTTVSTGFALNSTILAAINISAASYIFLSVA